jgi:hypothetical protein
MAYAGRDFSEIDIGENEVFGFDFAKELEAGETISAVTFTASDAAVLQPLGDPAITGTVATQR